MDIQMSIDRLLPRFILADRNGNALARGIEQAFRAIIEGAAEGWEVLTDVDSMPEWRLDEMAWELNCLYDYNADVESKRVWIKSAVKSSRILGTKAGVIQYLQGYFDRVELKENWEYGGQPYHYRLDAWGPWTQAKESWLLKAVKTAANARSVPDALTIHEPTLEAALNVFVGIALYVHETQVFSDMEDPDIDSLDVLADEGGALLLDEDSVILGE